MTATIEHKIIQVAETATDRLGSEWVQDLPLRDGDLVLYRKRASALMHAQFCPGKLFDSACPTIRLPSFPWIGLVFSNWMDPLVSREEFAGLWEKRVPVVMRDGFTEDSAWALLHRFARDHDQVKISRLRTLLSRPRPPVDFCYLDYGGHGPVFSTIHASKGREADRVFLMLPNNLNYLDGNSKIDRVEEARVFYVGSTRVKGEFLSGQEAKTMAGAGRIDSSGRRVGQDSFTQKSGQNSRSGLPGIWTTRPPSARLRPCAIRIQPPPPIRNSSLRLGAPRLKTMSVPKSMQSVNTLSSDTDRKNTVFILRPALPQLLGPASGLHKAPFGRPAT